MRDVRYKRVQLRALTALTFAPVQQVNMLPDAFGCAVANRFGDLLDDEADPLDLLSRVESLKDKKKRKEEEERKNKQKKPGQKETQRDRRVPPALDVQDLVPVHKQQVYPAPLPERRDGGDEAQRGTKRAAAGPRRGNKEQHPLQPFIMKPSHNDDSDLRDRGGSRGRRGARGGLTRSSDTFNLRGKREFDRHSSTGLSVEGKRGGRGPWNWGCVDEAGSELMEVTPEAAGKSEDPQTSLEEENLSLETEEDKEMVVQVAMEMTLDEWKAMQEMNRPKAEFNIRKAVDKIPSKAKVIHQSKNPENPRETIEDEGNFLRRSVNDITSLLDINFGSLGRPSRGGRGRGARGGQTTRPEMAKPLLEQEEDLAPNPDDPEDFPALSSGK
uniref:Hyaluronan/mRNA-binding protein domain-containing protein n=2 Tax=Oryzias latipes TaxID=8090 RepID=A0A3P9K0K8_ORYLA